MVCHCHKMWSICSGDYPFIVMWHHFLLRHMVDLMHCEKNICENMLKIIFKEKDVVAMRNNMQEVDIWLTLWLQRIPNGGYNKPIAPYVMIEQEKKAFLHIIKKLKTPSSYIRTLQSKVQKDGKLRGLKSHDYHIVMQHVLPLCLCKLT